MRINFSVPIRSLKGEIIKDEKDLPLMLERIACDALCTPYPDEKIEAGEKQRRFKLAMRISDGGEQDLSVEEIAELKKLIGRNYPPLVVGRCFEILDPEPQLKVIS